MQKTTKPQRELDRTAAPACETRPERLTLILVVIGLIGPLVLTAMMWGKLASYPYDWDPGEGDNIFYAWQFSQGQSPYNSYNQYPMTGSCYPPVYHLLVAPLVAVFGREVVVGRFVSWLAVLGTAAVVVVIVRHYTGSKWASICAALLYLASPTCRLWGAMARVDSLATFLGLAAFALLVVGRPSWLRVSAGALLGVAAIYTKPFALFFVAAGVLIVVLEDRRRGLAAAGICAALGLAILALCNSWTGGLFWYDTVTANATDYVLSRAVNFQFKLLSEHALLVVLALLGVVRAAGRERWMLLAGIAAGLAISCFTGKRGGSTNYQLPAIAAFCVAAGYALGSPKVSRDALLIGLALLVQGLIWTDTRLVAMPGAAERQAMDQVAAALREIPGPALVERNMTLQAKAGKQSVWEPCLLLYMYSSGKWNPEPVVKDIEVGKFSSVLAAQRFIAPPISQALARHYRRVRDFAVSDWTGTSRVTLFMPKAPAAPHTP